MSLSPETVTRRTTVKARKGETVATLAKRYRVSSLDVADWNRVTAHTAFKLGQDVVLYLPVKVASGKRGAKGKSNLKAGPKAATKTTAKATQR
jgi:membrane-bound lytic murein transglycosylase D